MSLFNTTTARPLRSKAKHWSFRNPDKRNPKMRDFLRVRKVAVVNPPRNGVYVFNGEACSSFEGVKTAARVNGVDILRMGAINVKL